MAGVLVVITQLATCACSQDKAPIRIATNPWPGYEILHVAQQQGFFKELGVKVQLVDFMSLADSSRAFARGQVDAWGATLIELLLNHANSNRVPQAFMVTDVSDGADMLLARASITHLSNLKGKRVAVEPATVNIVLLYHALKSVNLSLKDVSLVSMPHSEMKQAIAEGRVDAICVYPPLSVDILKSKDLVTLFDSSKVKNLIVDVLAADPDILQERQADFVKITKAFERARSFLQTHPDKAMAIISHREHISVEELKRSLLGIRLVDNSEQRSFFQQHGLLDQATYSTMQALLITQQIFESQVTHSVYSDQIISAMDRL